MPVVTPKTHCESTHFVDLINHFGRSNGFAVLLSLFGLPEAEESRQLLHTISRWERVLAQPFACDVFLPKLRESYFAARLRLAKIRPVTDEPALHHTLLALHERRFPQQYLLCRRDEWRFQIGKCSFAVQPLT